MRSRFETGARPDGGRQHGEHTHAAPFGLPPAVAGDETNPAGVPAVGAAADTRPAGLPVTRRGAMDTSVLDRGAAPDTNPGGLRARRHRAGSDRLHGNSGSGSTPVSPSVPRHDLPVLEAYRGVAALMVLVTHVGFTSGAGVVGPWAGWLARMDFGVALFFLLSGLLLFRPYVQAAYGTRPPVQVRSYLRRRYVRIYPAFLAALAGVYLLSPRARAQDESLWLQTLFLVQNYTTSFGEQLNGLVQTWSLVVEVSFYVTLPLLAWLALGRAGTMAIVLARASGDPAAGAPTGEARRASRLRRAGRALARGLGLRALRRRLTLPPRLMPHRPAIVLAALFIGSVAWRVGYMIASVDGYAPETLWLPAFIDWFVAGMALAWLRERPTPVPLKLRYLANAPGVCLCLAVAGYWLTTTRLGGPYDLTGATTEQGLFKHLIYAVIATLLLLPAVFGSPRAAWRRHAVTPLMRWLGQISFGVFLWHPMLMELIRDGLDYEMWQGGFWVTLILTVIATLAVGTLSWRYLEEPAQRRFRNGFRPSTARTPREPTAAPRLRRRHRQTVG